MIRTLLLCLALLFALPAAAQEAPVTLIADRISSTREGVLVAEGAVEVFSEGRRLTASRITYDSEADRLLIEGPIRLTEGPDRVIIADAADLSPDLQRGLIEGARVLLARQTQIGAGTVRRIDGRFTDMTNVVVTTCQICSPGQRPLWQVRARRVVEDAERQRLYYTRPHFRVLDVPVFWMPALSVPAPGVERARGFLVPTWQVTNLFGTGVRVPYFLPLGQSADLTFTPYIAGQEGGDFTRTMEYRYRQAFRRAYVTFSGAVSRDSLKDGTRAYVFGNGYYILPRDWILSFSIQDTSDYNYLNDYDYSTSNRLENTLALTKVKDDKRAEAKITRYVPLYEADNDTLPLLIGDLRYDLRWAVPRAGGWFDVSLIGKGHERASDENIVGRDSAHARAYLRYSNTVTAVGGLRVGWDARLIGDIKEIRQDDTYPERQTAITPGLGLTLGYPLRKRAGNGGVTLLEPVVQVIWTGEYDIDAPNDDSLQPSFDAGNLLSFNRFPGLDRVEEGLRANVALRWQHITPKGRRLGLTLGRVVRAESTDAFSVGTGLSGARSDWLAELSLGTRALTLRSQLLVDDDGNVTLSETRLRLAVDRFRFTGGYVQQIADPDLSLNSELSEIVFDAGYDISERWSAALDIRHDLVDEETVDTGLSVTYRTECVQLELFTDRSYRNTEDEEQTVTWGLQVGFAGFGTRGSGSGRCSG